MINLTSLFPTILTALMTAWLASPIAIALARRLNLVDVPGRSRHKQHAAPTPMAGGMVLVLALAAAAVVFGWVRDSTLLDVFLGALVVYVFGLWDDARGLGAPLKLTGQLLATWVLVLGGTEVHLFGYPWLNLAITFLWIVGVVNAFNFVDSMDGLALGLAGVASAFFMLVTLESGQPALAALSAGLFGACVGAYFFNLNPARMFLGDSGSQILGFLLAAIAVAYTPLDYALLSSWYVPILVLGVPIFDAVLVVSSRLRRRRKVYIAAMDHTYHRLRGLGLEATRAVYSMHLAGVGLGLVAFIGLNAPVVVGNLIFAGVVAVGIAGVVGFEMRGTIGADHG